MVPIVVRAKDSAAAMEEVVARLGPEALILSTGRRDGLFEITATIPGETGQGAPKEAAEAPASAAAPDPAPMVPDFQHLIDARLREEAPVETPVAVDVAVDAPVEIDNPLALPPMPSSPVAVADKPKRKSKRKRKAPAVAQVAAAQPGIEPARTAPVAVPATGGTLRAGQPVQDEGTPLRSGANVAAFTPDPRAPAGGWPIYSPAFRGELRDEMADHVDGSDFSKNY